MLIVLKCVNDSMHQIAITGFWVSWSAAQFQCLQHKLRESNPDGSGFGSLVVSMPASGTQDRGFEPGRSRQIFRAKKSTACLPSEGKYSVLSIYSF
jgi:hypothetical protein